MRSAAWVALLVAASVLAGCAQLPTGGTIVVTDRPAPVSPHVVLGVVDEGVNPYHVAFRDDSAEAWRHPAAYLPGYPATAQALRLTLNATFADALAADAAAWDAVEPGTLYWIPGTRIVAYYRTTEFAQLDPGGFGTAAAGRAAGNGTGLAPTAKLAIVQGTSDEGVVWATEQAWIDVLLVGWNTQRPPGVSAAVAQPLAAFAATRPLVVSAGNGLSLDGGGPLAGGSVGGVGLPAFADGTAGVAGAIAVGGHDNGKPTPWTGTVPHVVADATRAPVPSHEHERELAPADARAASGTTVSAAWVAGAVARLLLEARVLADDRSVGALVSGNATAAGPLDDGALALDELRALLLRTADPNVPTEPSDGGEGSTGAAARLTLPADWAQLPGGAWRFALVGYGAVTQASLDAALAVLRGDAELPPRADEDEWAARDAQLREALAPDG